MISANDSDKLDFIPDSQQHRSYLGLIEQPIILFLLLIELFHHMPLPIYPFLYRTILTFNELISGRVNLHTRPPRSTRPIVSSLIFFLPQK